MQTAQHTCKNCHHHFAGKFCNNCGEKVYTEHDKKISHLLEEVVHFSTHFDNRFFRTLKLIFVKPGFVSKEFCEGKRKNYYSPFSLFLVAVFLYLLFPTLQGLNISFDNHIVPLCALALRLIFARRKKYFFDHFIFASEFNAFFILYLFFLLPITFELVALMVPIGGVGDSNLLFIIIQFAVLWLVAGAGVKRFYEVSVVKAVLSSLLYLFFHSLIVFFIYRLILFAVVMFFI